QGTNVAILPAALVCCWGDCFLRALCAFVVNLLMDKEQVAAILDEIGTLLELQGENPFRCRAYSNAARVIEQLEVPLPDLVAAGKPGDAPAIGDPLREKIPTLVTTGRLPFYEDLKKKIPAGVLQMLRIQGMGPKKAKALYDQLGIDSLDKLK